MTSAVLRPLVALSLLAATSGADEGGEIYDFFAAEAHVITASQRPVPEHLAPATVHTVTAQDIAASGAQTLWDALRGLPGVDVMIVQTFQGQVGLRGLNKSLNNRVLVLLDGKSVLSGYFDRVTWEYLPVSLSEIDRIEVVVGPVSALHGPNAVSGVINVITKRPEDLGGPRARLSLGERQTVLGNAGYGIGDRRFSGHVGAGWRSTNRFENADEPASRVGHLRGHARFAPDPDLEVAVQGGISRVEGAQSLGGLGAMSEEGPVGFARADLRRGETRVHTFWNRNRTRIDNTNETDMPVRFDLDHDLVETSLEQSRETTAGSALTVGTSLRYDRVQSGALRAGVHTQTLESGFFEYQWLPRPRVLVLVGGRTDHHSQAGWQHSPRASVVWSPRGEHVLRLTAGSAFRFPTITESQFAFAQTVALPDSSPSGLPFGQIFLRIDSNRNLDAERMRTAEAAYSGRRGRLSFSVAGFVFRLRNVIASTPPRLSVTEEEVSVSVTFQNRDEDITGWGGEIDLQADLWRGLTGRANYSLQDIDAVADPLVATQGGPPHKVNLGLTGARNGWNGSLWLHHVTATRWFANRLSLTPGGTAPLDAYSLVNVHVGRDLGAGFSFGLNAFNLLDEKHFEVLPALAPQQLGQSGQIVRRRVTATLTWEP